MAWDLAYTIRFGNLDGFTTITSDVLSFTTDLQIEIGQFNTSTATFTIKNNDGKYTPNGTGTYSDIDWFSQIIEVKASLAGYTDTVFYGVIQEFEVVQENKFQSTVTITAVDPITIAGRSTATQPLSGYLFYTADALSQIINGYVYGGNTVFEEVSFPTFASNVDEKAGISSSLISPPLPSEQTSQVFTDLITDGTVSDKINNTILPSGPTTAWADLIYQSTQPQMIFSVVAVDYPLSRADSNAWNFMFNKNFNQSSYDIYQLPLNSFEESYVKETLSNSCTATSSDGFDEAYSEDLGSISLYGMRNKVFSGLANYTLAENERVAQFWANRFSTVRYGVKTLTITYKTAQLNQKGVAEEYFANLLYQNSSVMQECQVHNDTTGSNFTRYMILGRTIDADPTDTKITLTLGWFFDYSSVILSDTTDPLLAYRSGTPNVLGGGGYDDAATTYDSASVLYNNGPVTGSRLA